MPDDTHDEWCYLNACEPYITWMEEYEETIGYKDTDAEEWVGPE